MTIKKLHTITPQKTKIYLLDDYGGYICKLNRKSETIMEIFNDYKVGFIEVKHGYLIISILKP